MFVEQISIFIENKEGRLAEVTAILRDANINIRALSLADTTDFGVLRLIVANPETAERVLMYLFVFQEGYPKMNPVD